MSLKRTHGKLVVHQRDREELIESFRQSRNLQFLARAVKSRHWDDRFPLPGLVPLQALRDRNIKIIPNQLKACWPGSSDVAAALRPGRIGVVHHKILMIMHALQQEMVLTVTRLQRV